jgi:two-component system response regulator YesN
LKMMLVDDEPLEREVLTRIIKKENFGISEMYEAKNGLEAVNLAKQKQMDLILMDIKMPVLDGLMATEAIKKDLPDCIIIFLTAHDEVDIADRIIKLGGDDYLLKPAHPKEVRQTLIKYIPMQNSNVLRSIETPIFCEHSGIKTIMEYINNNLHLDLNLDALAELVYLNRQYLSRLFKQITGYTITQYITDCRLEKAKYYLSHYSQDTVTEISLKCGFVDSNYFARVFKKHVGITPTQFQQQAQSSRKKRMNTFNNFVM